MNKKIYKIGQKIQSTLISHDYITSAEFESRFIKYYGLISEIIDVTEPFELPDGTTEHITTTVYYAISMRTEIDRYITFDDGFQHEKYHKRETINFPLDRVYIGEDDRSAEFNFIPVKEFNFTHNSSLFD